MAGLFGSLDNLIGLTDEEVAALAAEIEANERQGQLDSLSSRLGAARANRGIADFQDLTPVPANKNSFNTPFGAVPNANAYGVPSPVQQDPLDSLNPNNAQTRSRHQASMRGIEGAFAAQEAKKSEEQLDALRAALGTQRAERDLARAVDSLNEQASNRQSINDVTNTIAALDAIADVPNIDALDALGAVSEDSIAASDIAAALDAIGITPPEFGEIAEAQTTDIGDEVAQAQAPAPVADLDANPLGLDIDMALAEMEAAADRAATPPTTLAPPAVANALHNEEATAVPAAPVDAMGLTPNQTQALGNISNAVEATNSQPTTTPAPGLIGGLGLASLDDEGMSNAPSFATPGSNPGNVGGFAQGGMAPDIAGPMSGPMNFGAVDFSAPAPVSGGNFDSFGSMGSAPSPNGLPGTDIGFSQGSPVGGLMGGNTAPMGSNQGTYSGLNDAADTTFSAQQSTPGSNFSATANGFGSLGGFGNPATQAAIDAAFEGLAEETSNIGAASPATAGLSAPGTTSTPARGSFSFTGNNAMAAPAMAAAATLPTIDGVKFSAVENLTPLSTMQFATARARPAVNTQRRTAPVAVPARNPQRNGLRGLNTSLTNNNARTGFGVSSNPGISPIGAIDAGYGFDSGGFALSNTGAPIGGAQFSDGTPIGQFFSEERDPNANYGNVGDTVGGDAGSDKVICTAMNDSYGFGSFRQAIWLQESKNRHPAYERGYHVIAIPMIKYAWGGTSWPRRALRAFMEHAARRRTADIWKQKRGRRDWIGAVERSIIEPICYIVGKIKGA